MDWEGPIRPPSLVSQPWGIWGIGAKHDYDDISEDYFDVYNISVAQFDDFRDNYEFLLKISENQDESLKSLFFDFKKCVIPQENLQKNQHLILK